MKNGPRIISPLSTALVAPALLILATAGESQGAETSDWDEVTASAQSSGAIEFPGRKQVCEGNGCWIGLGQDGKLRFSKDVVTWVEPMGSRTEDFMRSISYGTGRFVAVGGSYFAGKPVILSSVDGCHWHAARSPVKRILHSVAFGTDRFVAVGDEGAIVVSKDGRHWGAIKSPTTVSLAVVVFGDGLFMAGGEDGVLLGSTDGAGWAMQNLGAKVYVSKISIVSDALYFGEMFATSSPPSVCLPAR
jgi:hypothetical protein